MSKACGRACLPVCGYPIKRIVLSGLFGIFMTALLTIGGAFLLQREVLPLTCCRWLGPVIVALSAFCTGWLSARRNDKKLICGLLAALLYGLCLFICGMLLFSAPMQPARLGLSFGALLAGTILAVVLSAFGE